MKYILTFIFTAVFFLHSSAQKVATYATGTPGNADYESFAFWEDKSGKRSFITYNYGPDKKEAKVSYGGASQFKGISSFKIQFNNKLVLHVMTNGNQLQIADNSGKYLKTFVWEYEGPVNGVGSVCFVCAENAERAIEIVKRFY